MSDARPARTVGGSGLRASIEEAQRRITEDAAAAPSDAKTVTVFAAYDRETGAEIGLAMHWQGPKGSEWTVSGALARKTTAATSPYGVRLELRGRL